MAVQLGTPWQNGVGLYHNVINLYITNNGTQATNVPWAIALFKSFYKSVDSNWNFTVTSVNNGTITGIASESWQTLLPKGSNTINTGLIVSSTSVNFMPSSITINGASCSVTVK